MGGPLSVGGLFGGASEVEPGGEPAGGVESAPVVGEGGGPLSVAEGGPVGGVVEPGLAGGEPLLSVAPVREA